MVKRRSFGWIWDAGMFTQLNNYLNTLQMNLTITTKQLLTNIHYKWPKRRRNEAKRWLPILNNFSKKMGYYSRCFFLSFTSNNTSDNNYSYTVIVYRHSRKGFVSKAHPLLHNRSLQPRQWWQPICNWCPCTYILSIAHCEQWIMFFSILIETNFP